MAYDNELQIYQGNSKTLLCAVLDSSSLAMDLTDYSGSFYAKKFPVKSSATYDVSVGHTSKDATNGVFTFELSTTDTSLAVGDYIYEVVITATGKNISVIQDTLKILDSIK